MSGLPFWVRSLFLSFSVVVVSVFLERYSSGSHRAHPSRTFLVCFLFLVLSPPRLVYRPFWPCVPSFSRFVGVPFWAPGVFVFSRILSVLWGAGDYSPPSEALFSGREAARVFWSILSVVFVFPFCCVCGFFTHSRRVEPSSYEPDPGSSNPPRARVRARGAPSCAAVWTRPFGIHFSLLRVWQRVTGTPGTIFGGEGRILPPQVPFFTRTFCSRPSLFFSFFLSFAGLRSPEWDAFRICIPLE